MMRTIFLSLLGVLVAVFVAGMAWLAIPGCQTNHLIISGTGEANVSAIVRSGEQVLWSGTPGKPVRVDFIARTRAQNFTVSTSSGLITDRGYAEPIDGQLHTLIISSHSADYHSEHRNLLSHGRDEIACRYWPGPGPGYEDVPWWHWWQ